METNRRYDLRTGEMYWEISPSPLPSGTSLVGIEYTGLTTPAVPGATEQASAGASLVALGRTTLAKINTWTGAVTLERSIESGSHSYYHNGYVLTCQDLGSGAEPDRYRLVNWTTFGSSSDFDSRIESNITWPFTRSLSPGMAFDFEAGYAANTGPYARPAGPGDTDVTPPEVGATIRVRITSASVETGEVKWSELVDITPFDAMQAYCADHGKIAVVLQDGTWRAYDLETGDLAWVSERMDYPWDATGFGSYGAASAYGLLFRFAYSGIYAFDWTNGEIAWKYEATAPDQYETPYYGRNDTVVYPFDGTGWIADKKVYAVNTEHTPTAPITRGWGVHCVDAMTGDLVWKMTMPSGGVGGGISGTPGGISAIVDGYMVVSSLEGYMYVFGKGKSEATVTASPKTVAKGSQVLIEGTVLDQSSAQPDTPCVSKESMTTQMEYLHMQFPIGGIEGDAVITGVPVSLSAVDESGNHVEIGTTTTNGYFGTFAYAWTPPDEGTYEIIATFAGDDSYGSSGAATAVTVGPAAEEVDLAPLESDVSDLGGSVDSLESGMSNLTTYIIAVLVIAIIALVIGLYLALRPRK
jgi:hypothetical protein